jgi:hypothetical protein
MTGKADSMAATSGRGGGSSSRSNPFCRNKPGSGSTSATPNRTLKYEIGGRHVTLSGQQYACYEKIWREQLSVAYETNYIAGE